MAVTQTYTTLEICTAALKKIGVTAQDEDANAYDIDTAKTALEMMLKSWQNQDIEIFTKASQSVTLTTATSYTMSPERPLSVDQVNFKNTSGIETPMIELTREEYDSLPDKDSTGIPTNYYYDRQRENALLYIWPVMASATTESLEITYTREIADVDLSEAIDLPAEWYRAAVYNLAWDLTDDYNISEPRASRVGQKAMKFLDDALGYDREGSVYFAGEWAD